MINVFISHVGEEREFAEQIAVALAEAGHTPWWDIPMGGGDAVSAELAAVLDHVGVVVTLYSIRAQWSSEVEAVARYALSKGKHLHAFLDRPESVPFPMSADDAIDLSRFNRDPEQIEALTAAVSRRIGPGAPETGRDGVAARLGAAALEAERWGRTVAQGESRAYFDYLRQTQDRGVFRALAQKRLREFEGVDAAEGRPAARGWALTAAVAAAVLGVGGAVATQPLWSGSNGPAVIEPASAATQALLTETQAALGPDADLDDLIAAIVAELDAERIAEKVETLGTELRDELSERQYALIEQGEALRKTQESAQAAEAERAAAAAALREEIEAKIAALGAAQSDASSEGAADPAALSALREELATQAEALSDAQNAAEAAARDQAETLTALRADLAAQAEAIGAVETRLEDAAGPAELEAIKTALADDMTTATAAVAEAEAARAAAITELRDTLSAQRADLVSAQEAGATREEALASLGEQMARFTETLAQAQAEDDARGAAIDALREELDAQATRLAAAEQGVETGASEISDAKRRLAEEEAREAEAVELAAQRLSELTQFRTGLDLRIAELADDVAALRFTEDSRVDDLETVRAAFADQLRRTIDTRLTDLTAAAERAETAAARVGEETAGRDEVTALIQAAVEESVAALRAELNATTEAQAQAQTEAVALLESRMDEFAESDDVVASALAIEGQLETTASELRNALEAAQAQAEQTRAEQDSLAQTMRAQIAEQIAALAPSAVPEAGTAIVSSAVEQRLTAQADALATLQADGPRRAQAQQAALDAAIAALEERLSVQADALDGRVTKLAALLEARAEEQAEEEADARAEQDAAARADAADRAAASEAAEALAETRAATSALRDDLAAQITALREGAEQDRARLEAQSEMISDLRAALSAQADAHAAALAETRAALAAAKEAAAADATEDAAQALTSPLTPQRLALRERALRRLEENADALRARVAGLTDAQDAETEDAALDASDAGAAAETEARLDPPTTTDPAPTETETSEDDTPPNTETAAAAEEAEEEEAEAEPDKLEPDPRSRRAQSNLQRLGFDVGGVDGVWGARSEEAMTEYQLMVGLPATGVLDDVSADLLAAAPDDLLNGVTVSIYFRDTDASREKGERLRLFVRNNGGRVLNFRTINQICNTVTAPDRTHYGYAAGFDRQVRYTRVMFDRANSSRWVKTTGESDFLVAFCGD